MVIVLAGGVALAQQEQEAKKDSGEAGEPTEEEKRKADALEEALRRLEEGLTESVTVTATRVETDLMKTPIAITVLDQETMDREGIRNVRDIAQSVPNMDIATVNGQSTPIISLRGIRSTNTTELGDPSVGVHLDGIYSPRMQGILGLMFDNERVEVARGPQGTLFGRNSTVGSINIVSAKPKLDRAFSSINLQYGNFNAPEVQVMANKPLSDSWAVRFAGRYHQRDSYIDGYWDPNQYDQRRLSPLLGELQQIGLGGECLSQECHTRTQNNNWWADFGDRPLFALQRADDDDFYMNAKEWAYRGSAYWEPTDKDMTLNLSFQHFRTDGAGGVDLVNCDKLRGRPNYSNVFATGPDGEQILDNNGLPILIGLVQNGTADCSDLFPEDDTYQAVVNTPGRLFLDIMYLRSQYNWDINDNLRFVALVGAEELDRESDVDMEQSLNAWDQSFHFLPGTGSKSWSPELQLQSFGNKHLNWIVGANHFYEKTSTFGYFDNAIGEKSMFFQPDRSTTAYALFAQGTYSYSERWHMTLGGRYSDETKEDVGGRTLICNPDADDNDCLRAELGWGEVDSGLNGFDRDLLNALPANFFEDPAVYSQEGVVQNNDLRRSWSHADWRVGLDFQKDDDSLWYAYLATGFKSGGIGDVFRSTISRGLRDDEGNALPPCAPIQILLGICSELNPINTDITLETDFDEEEVTTLELGFKERLFDGKLELRGAYFYSLYDDLQYAYVGALAYTEKYGPYTDINGTELDIDGDGNIDFDWFGRPAITGFLTENVPEVTLQGFELEYDWRPWKGGRINGYVSWIDSEITDDWITKWNYDPVSYLNLSFDESLDSENDVLQVNLRGNEMAVSPPWKVHVTFDHAFNFERQQMTIVPWLTAHWEDDSYLTIFNVDKHTDDMNFVISDEDIRYTDDKREAWSMFHAGVRLYRGNLMAEIYGYNLTDEVVQWWGGAAEQVAKGSFSMPLTYGVRFGYKF